MQQNLKSNQNNNQSKQVNHRSKQPNQITNKQSNPRNLNQSNIKYETPKVITKTKPKDEIHNKTQNTSTKRIKTLKPQAKQISPHP